MALSQESRPHLASVFANKTADAVSEWLQKVLNKLPLDRVKLITSDLDAAHPTDTIRRMLDAAAMQVWHENGTIDAYAVAKLFDSTLAWPVDGDFVAIVHHSITFVRERALRMSTMEWVLRSGTRFKHVEGDIINFQHKGELRAGKIVEVHAGLAQGVVELYGDGLDTRVIVNAEAVHGNAYG